MEIKRHWARYLTNDRLGLPSDLHATPTARDEVSPKRREAEAEREASEAHLTAAIREGYRVNSLCLVLDVLNSPSFKAPIETGTKEGNRHKQLTSDSLAIELQSAIDAFAEAQCRLHFPGIVCVIDAMRDTRSPETKEGVDVGAVQKVLLTVASNWQSSLKSLMQCCQVRQDSAGDAKDTQTKAHSSFFGRGRLGGGAETDSPHKDRQFGRMILSSRVLEERGPGVFLNVVLAATLDCLLSRYYRPWEKLVRDLDTVGLDDLLVSSLEVERFIQSINS
ncbi:hypothetical protein KIPB_006733 [Kipferlia bialata]|uniref:Uncharacterized protein n=1 Tax=Kipferlia bialata TaxID=797122 RepID=A0A9K3GID7_9EUKA|nr:hypothetical protein KIPB_006733 [Kipferlia bialata]|eukprot:g6733.t1